MPQERKTTYSVLFHFCLDGSPLRNLRKQGIRLTSLDTMLCWNLWVMSLEVSQGSSFDAKSGQSSQPTRRLRHRMQCTFPTPPALQRKDVRHPEAGLPKHWSSPCDWQLSTFNQQPKQVSVRPSTKPWQTLQMWLDNDFISGILRSI